ncbi:MAG: ATP-binding protein [Bacteroidales bacterium]|nr:ATP-binding protein [Candidatus Cacconaster merdequi]
MKRKITEHLLNWKSTPEHKPLILQGARQVGKSYILEEFGRTCYKNYVKVSLDLVPDVRDFLAKNIDPMEIIAFLESMYNIRIIPGETLVFLDEIQDCKRALLSLKYFQEQHPEYDIVAAGSLLGVAINNDESDDSRFSYPVGKVDELTLYPMDFEEFLWAMDKDILSENIREHFATNEKMPESLHNQALDLYQKYLIVGGMPESVLKYQQTQSYFTSREIQQSILAGYDKDMTKYSSPATAVKIRACFNSIPAQLAKENRKFQYKLAKKGGTATIFGEAIQWLMQSGVASKCTLVSHGYLPLSAQVDDSDFKIYMSDVGLLGAKAQIPATMLLGSIDADNTFLGSVAENYVAQQLQALNHTLFYWKNDNTAELEFVLQIEDNIIPTEVKKGRRVKALSMTQFMEKYKAPLAYRISGKNFGLANGVKAIPLYAVFCI